MKRSTLKLLIATLWLTALFSCQTKSSTQTYYCEVISDALTSEQIKTIEDELFTQGLVIGYGIDYSITHKGTATTLNGAIEEADNKAKEHFNEQTNSINVAKFQTLFPEGINFTYVLLRVNSDATETQIDSRKVTIPETIIL